MAIPDRTQLLLLVALPLSLLASDFYCIFLTPPPPRPHHRHNPQHKDSSPSSPLAFSPPLTQVSGRTGAVDSSSLGGKFHISFCASCSYKKTAIETRNALMSYFPGTDVALTNYPPPLAKRMLIKLIPLAQFAGLGLVLGGDHIFPRLGYASPPAWYNYLRQNRFGAAAGCWILGNVLQSTLQSTGAFEVYFDGDLIFSKLREGRFPYEFELREIVGKTLEVKTKL